MKKKEEKKYCYHYKKDEVRQVNVVGYKWEWEKARKW